MNTLSLTEVFNPDPGWYRGDLHLHTTFSDGHHPPVELAQLARDEGLDFIAVTDHNSIDSFSEFGDDPGILVIPGIEATVTDGHWNVFGMPGWQEWLQKVCVGRMSFSLKGTGLTTNDLLQQSSNLGLLNSVNHPLLKPWEWRDGLTDLRYVNCIEIWNDPLWPDNEQANPQAVALWTNWLNAGYRITAIGGSDFHFLPGESPGYPGERPGLPMTYVWAQELSGAGVLAGIKSQRVYVSMGPRLTFNADADGKTEDIGGDLGIISGEVNLTASIYEAPDGSCMRLVKGGKTIHQAAVKGGLMAEFSDTTSSERPEWYRLEVVDSEERVLALTNPIYTGPRRQPRITEFGGFVRQNQILALIDEN